MDSTCHMLLSACTVWMIMQCGQNESSKWAEILYFCPRVNKFSVFLFFCSCLNGDLEKGA